VRAIVDTPTTTLAKLEMHETTLAPGASPHAPHRHTDEELLYVHTGTLEVLQGDVTRIAREGSVIFHASNELHGMRNVGRDTARYLVIRVAPRRLDVPPGGSAPRADGVTSPSSSHATVRGVGFMLTQTPEPKL
jgi:quercetin dioxygenase-like cupin family protein